MRPATPATRSCPLWTAAKPLCANTGSHAVRLSTTAAQQRSKPTSPSATKCACASDDAQRKPADDSVAAPAQTSTSIWNLPTILTVARLFAIPPILYLFTCSTPAAAQAATGVFLAAAFTDWLDGFLARRWNVSTPFGAFLDPVADKLMVSAVLIMLCTKSFETGLFAAQPWLLPTLTVAIISRELAMSALREWAAGLSAEARALVAVNAFGKWKTTLQMAALTALLYAMDGGAAAGVGLAAEAGPWLLIGATALTVHSFVVYFRAMWRFMA